MTIPKTRVRARKPKTRTGCKTCRIRRIKCDEQKPSCRKCLSTGRQCDGYEAFVQANPVERPDKAALPVHRGRMLSISSLSSGLNLTEEESLGFEFFRTNTASEIQGCFNSSLWESLVLQISHQEPAVLHAVIAVGFVHGKFAEKNLLSIDNMNIPDPRTLIGLRQYVKAIEYLRTRINELEDPQSSQIALMVCLLFICLEMMRGQRVSALTHLGTGLRILSSRAEHFQHGVSNALVLKHDSEGILDQLVSIFARLDCDSTMSGQRSPHFLLLSQQKSDKQKLIPSTFLDISEARQYMDILTNRVLRLRGQLLAIAADSVSDATMDLPTRICWEHATTRKIDLSNYPEILAEMRKLQNGLAVWSSALHAFETAKNGSQQDGNSRATTLLKMQHFFSYFLISTCQTTKEKYCDSFDPLFKNIVSLANTYIRETPSGGRQLFTLESGILSSLYLVALKCRHPATRRRAIVLLEEASFQEGMWEAQLMAQFVAHIADFEEQRAGHGTALTESSEIGEEARFCDVVLSASPDPRMGKLICARYCHGKDGGLIVLEEEFLLSPWPH